MFKLFGVPSPKADINELADFVEIECLKKTQFSRNETIAALGRIDENIDISSNKIIDQLEIKVDDIFSEFDFRIKSCNHVYPFILESSGKVLKVNAEDNQSTFHLYQFLLLATRLNMQSDKINGGIDGTLLFEKISQQILSNYLGSRAESFLFGTSNHGRSFEDKINTLCKHLKEGNGFINRNQKSSGQVKDDSLDIVAWKPFSDDCYGKLIAFGQCKTGTRWQDTTTKLQPDAFCSSWFRNTPPVPPIRIFFICESLLRNQWHTTVNKAGILFDRCRIMDYCQNLSDELLDKITVWSDAALKKLLDDI
ncbi:MAG: hypothetical protein PF503_13890 [Desulfobacula sp.]|jgi:hypothetical protein|nr:hypothetical protein [Desulfobacula sp.]